MTCKGCEHWGDEDDLLDDLPNHRQCQAIRHLNEYGQPDDEGKRTLIPIAYLMDASGYQASLYTLPTFSCSLFTARHDSGPLEGIVVEKGESNDGT